MTIEFDTIPGSTRKPGAYSELNTKLANSALPANLQKLLLIGLRVAKFIEPARFQGGTLNDMTSQGTFTGTVKKAFIVKITTAAATDKFKYSTDNGVTWSAEASITGAAQTLDLGVTVTFGAVTGHALNDEWRFTAWAEPSVAEAVPAEIFSAGEAAEKFGYGSIVHQMALAAIEANNYLSLHVCALDDAGASAQAVGAFTVAGTATASGALRLHIGRVTVEVAVGKDDTAAEIALALQGELENHPELGVTIAVNAVTPGKIDLKAKNYGTLGNGILIGYDNTAKGITLTVTTMASGATDPDIDDALTPVAAERYHIIASALADDASLAKLKAHLDTVSSALEQRPGIGIFGSTGALATAVASASALNHARTQNIFIRYTSATARRDTPWQAASAYASVKAKEEDPAKPLNYIELKGVPVPAVDDRLSRAEQESCLHNGVTPLMVGPSGRTIQIVRAITTYTLSDAGAEDPSLLDVTKITSLDYVRDALTTRILARFPRSKKTSQVKNDVRAEVIAVLYQLEKLEIVENVKANLAGILVEDNAVESGRVDVRVPSDIVDGLHVVAQRIDLLV